MKKYIMFLIAGALCSASCSRKHYIPVTAENVAVSSELRDNIISRIDTVVERDTVSIIISEAGDTVCRTVTRWRSRIRERVDTVTIVKTDSVSREIPKVVAVPEKPPADLSVPAKLALSVVLAVILIKLIIPYLNKKI